MSPKSFYFPFIYDVLEACTDAYMVESGEPLEIIGPKVISDLNSLSDNYYDTDPAPDYSSALRRIGYIYTFAAAHAFLIEQVLDTCWQLDKALRKARNLNVCAVGGGPGSDFIGLTRRLLQRQSKFSGLHWTSIDRCADWSYDAHIVWAHCLKRLESHLDRTLDVHCSFHECDMLRPRWEPSVYGTLSNAGMVTMNHILSEHRGRMADVDKMIAELVRSVMPGTYFVVVDNLIGGMTEFRDSVTTLWQRHQVKCVCVRDFSAWLPEDKALLFPYYPLFGPRIPKTKFWLDTDKGKPSVFFAVFLRT